MGCGAMPRPQAAVFTPPARAVGCSKRHHGGQPTEPRSIRPPKPPPASCQPPHCRPAKQHQPRHVRTDRDRRGGDGHAVQLRHTGEARGRRPRHGRRRRCGPDLQAAPRRLRRSGPSQHRADHLPPCRAAPGATVWRVRGGRDLRGAREAFGWRLVFARCRCRAAALSGGTPSWSPDGRRRGAVTGCPQTSSAAYLAVTARLRCDVGWSVTAGFFAANFSRACSSLRGTGDSSARRRIGPCGGDRWCRGGVIYRVDQTRVRSR